MNLSTIRKMIQNGDMSKEALRYLLRCGGECEYLDFKQSLDSNPDYLAGSLGRDILAMKNTGGGYIVIGVEDKTWKPIGFKSPMRFDTKQLRDLVRKATGLDLDVDIVHHQIYLDDGSQGYFGLILVRASAKSHKRRSPSLCKHDFKPNEKYGLRSGDIFIRRGDSTVKISTQEELEELLEDLDTKHEFQDIAESENQASPFAIQHGLYHLLPTGYDAFIGRESLRLKVLQAVEQDPRIWIINLHGPGGAGKTALAMWAAYHYYNNSRTSFEAILSLSAKERELTSSGINILRPTLYSLENLLENILVLFGYHDLLQQSLDIQKSEVIEIFKVFRCLIILDNMETVNDGRIMSFIQSLPPSNQSKFLLTSRRRTDGWEFPLPIEELSVEEVEEFVKIRSEEMNLDHRFWSKDDIEKLKNVTGGLPLAIQWFLGRYAVTGSLVEISRTATSSDSPLLEFSFRNSWQVLDNNARQAMAVLSIFDDAPTLQEWRTSLDWPVDKMDKAIESLKNMTFVYTSTDTKTGEVTHRALPITLTFSRNMLATMGNLERECRARYQKHAEAMQLVAQEANRYQSIFETFVAESENEKKAIVLCRMADSQEELGSEAAEQYYQQALDLEPRSVYVLVKYGRFLVSLGRIGEGLNLLTQATKRSTKRTGFFAHYNLALAYDSLRQKQNCIESLSKALEYSPEHIHARHLLGVTLSRVGEYEKAIAIFDELIQKEISRSSGPTNTLVYALKTKVITIQKSKGNPEAEGFLKEAIQLVAQFPRTKHLVSSLEEIWLDLS